MSTITVYGFEDADGNESGTFTTMNIDEAVEHARQYHLRVVAMDYEYSESTVVWEANFTETDCLCPDCEESSSDGHGGSQEHTLCYVCETAGCAEGKSVCTENA